MLVAENVDSFKGCHFYSVNEVITNHINLDGLPQRTKRILRDGHDRVGVPDLSVSGDNFDLVEDDPHDPTTMSEPEAPMQSLNQLLVVTDLVDARSA
jgi:hypothetical protein